MANYVAYRPDYPAEMLEVFEAEMGLDKDSVVADIGCGPGQSSRPFLEFGCEVIGVEPNGLMREAAEDLLSGFDRFSTTPGNAAATGLARDSVDIVVAAQAFHWFDDETTVCEFERILKPGGYTALIWNERQLDSTPFLAGYEQMLLEFGTDYTSVRHDDLTEESIERSLGRKIRKATFPNRQVLDLDGLIGRLRSSSYTPAEGQPGFDRMISRTKELFAEHNENGKIAISYDTNVFYAGF